ncbi:MAG: tetratricopeptide repeat protein [Treponema sp.]|jgi:tetratricopeptide (TPR) repeat protein|nr:tetratricopeptide repeat protein [Treponema sp.]
MGQLDRALTVNATLSEACYGRSNAYRSLGDLDKAITDFNQALRIDPNHCQCVVRQCGQ